MGIAERNLEHTAGRVSIVTGAGQGIGSGIAEVLAEKGYIVYIAEKNEETGRRVTHQLSERFPGRIYFHQTDVTDEEAIKSLVRTVEERHDRLDALVNNAGTNVFIDPIASTNEEWDFCMDLNLKSVWRMCKHSVSLMRKNGGGAIVNIASVHALMTNEGRFPYAAAKAGIVGLTRSLALDLARDQIRVNAVCPGLIDTPLADAFFNEQPDPEKARQEAIVANPLGRMGTPRDIGGAVAFLLSDEATFITGTTLIVDGGVTARLS